MKRRNAEFGKLRRPVKRNKIAEGFYWLSNFLNAKYFFLWGLVVTADFMLDFRFELLWPFWLLLRSVYDSYKYKGLTFTILFVCIAITSDLVCLFFIPINWLFFLASTYVWVQYVWHSVVDKGCCMPTIFLWTLFLYLEGAVRWRSDKTMPHIDLCRPFAAHCIGYPVVTLGFGIKSYIGYRIRNRKQREVAKENEFFIQLLQLALPNDNPTEDEIIAQMQQTHEILHSDKFGDIDLPISSPIITQRIQQQRLLLANNLLNGIPESVGSRDESGGSHKLISNHTMNGFPSQIAISSKASTLPIATVSASAGAAVNSVPAATLNHSNNNILSSSNLNLSTDGLNGNHHQPVNSQPQNNHHNHHHHHHQQQSTTQQNVTAASIPTYRNNRRSVERSDNEANESDIMSSSSVRNLFKLIVVRTKANSFGAGIKRWYHIIMLIVIGKISTANSAIRRKFIGATDNSGFGSNSGSSSGSNRVTSTSTITTTSTNTAVTTANGINSLNRTGNSHRSTETNGHLNTAIVAPMNAKADNETSNGHIVQTSYSNCQSRANDTEKTFCDNQFNQLENNCNNGTEHIERGRGRRNRGKQKEIIAQNCKENHVMRNLSPVSQQSEHCESCGRLDGELKRLRNEINHLKHLEHELRHKNEQNSATKSCLQAKQRENDDLEKRIQELVLVRQTDKQNLQQIERKLAEERRQKQSVESQLNNERNKRKQTEEKLSRVDCSENCKLRKQILENECKQLRKELSVIEELKKSAEKQSRNYEQELRKFEAELRSREPRESTEVLMSALQAMQEKNKTLEKSLSAETRVKLDLFSALGEAKRQLEIRDNLIRQKDKDVADLKAKLAQLYAVMPNEQYLPSSPTPLLRLSDTGPSSPLSHAHATDTIYTQNNDVQ